MKRRALLICVLITAVLAAAFAVAGCTRSQPHITTDEYVLITDDAGRTYRLYGGDTIVAFYECESDKELNIYYEKFDADTDEVVSEKSVCYSGDCNGPSVREYGFGVKRNGAGDRATLKVIISSQTFTERLEDDSKKVRGYVYRDVGVTYAFKPKMTGRYTVYCTPYEDSSEDEVDYGFYDHNGRWLGKSAVLNKGHDIYINVTATPKEGSLTRVWTCAQFTPDVVELGDTAVTLGEYNVYEFTPEESGVYSVTDTEDASYVILDGETYEMITETQWEYEVPLIADKKYILMGQVGYKNPREATLTVKFVDNPLPLGEETDCIWNRYYVFTVPETCNYTVTVDLQRNYSCAANLTIYGERAREVLDYTFRDDCEYSLVLDAGKYYVRVDEDGKITCNRTPVIWQSGQRLKSGERSVFVAPFNCIYDFDAYRTGAEVIVMDKDDNSVADQKLTAGEEYVVYVEFEQTYENGYATSDWVSAEPRTAGQLGQNVKVENVADGEPYLFSPDRWGRYKFTGAAELAVYDGVKPCETYGDTAELQNNKSYYIVLVADELTYANSVTVRYYPQALPTDGLTSANNSQLYFALPFDDGVTINFRHSAELEYSLLDADFNEVKTGSLVGGGTLHTDSITAQLQAGYYYLFTSVSTVEVWFNAAPLGCGGTLTVERGDRFKSSTEATYRYACGLGRKEITVNVFDSALMNYSVKDEVNLYYMDGGTTRKLQIKSIEYNNLRWTIKFTAEQNVGEYFLEFKNHSYEFAIERYV